MSATEEEVENKRLNKDNGEIDFDSQRNFPGKSSQIRLQKVRVQLTRLSDISQMTGTAGITSSPTERKRGRPVKPSGGSGSSPGSESRKTAQFLQVPDSDSSSSSPMSAIRIKGGNSPLSERFSSPRPMVPIRLHRTRKRYHSSDNKENEDSSDHSVMERIERTRVSAIIKDPTWTDSESDIPIDDITTEIGGTKVNLLRSPKISQGHKYNERGDKNRRGDDNEADSADIEDNSEIEIETSNRLSGVTKTKTSGKSQEILNSDKLSFFSGKKYRRSSLMAKLLDTEMTDTTDDEAKEAVQSKLKSQRANSIKEGHEDETGSNSNALEIDSPVTAEQVKKTKKKVRFSLDIEERVESEEPAQVSEDAIESVEPEEPEVDMSVLLSVVWARIGGHPWWPGIVCNEPEQGVFTRTKLRQGNRKTREMNVSFFGENTRAWVEEKNLRAFEGLEEFERYKTEVLKDVTNKGNRLKLMKNFNPTNSMKDKWQASVEGAERVRTMSAELRMEEMIAINQEMSASNSKKKRKLSVEADLVETDDDMSAPAKKPRLEESGTEGETRRVGGATRRQQDVKQKQEEREKKEKEKGPGWYYEVIGPKKPSEEPEQKLGQFVSGRCCLTCEEPAGQSGPVWKCRGCSAHHHPQCLQVDATTTTAETFRCRECEAGDGRCLLCGEVSKEGETAKRCSVSGCWKSFHVSCLTRYTIWPQAKITNGNIYCPDHICHTCASENTKDPTMKYNEKLMHCTRCPTAYHAGDHCVAAGTIQITKTDIICPKHFTPAKTKKSSSTSHVNTNWCFICSLGGSLLCCEKCPASFHEECLGLKEPLADKYFCEDCQSGRLPLYNDIVWAKWGAFRWWPALVLHPLNVPDNIEKVKHQDGEFPIKFLGSGDYNWINQGRTFFYEDGDSEKVPSLSNSKSMDATFRRGLAEAEELYRDLRQARLTREKENCLSAVGSKIKGGNKPQYVKIKNNKPFGNCPTYSVDPKECQPCDCHAGKYKDNPCGEESNCMNRMLMFECHPNVCPVKDSCKNMRFQKRQYPPLECFRTMEGRGWGLRSQTGIKKGQFVIEYVGELITMEEYRTRMAADQLAGQENYYYLTIDSNRMIDAGPKGNLARFMNHSCDPNCITEKWTVNGDTRVGLFAIKDVAPGTELTFNYQFETVGDNKKKCECGADNCSGLIGEKPQNKEKEEKKVSKMLKDKKKKKIKKKSSKPPGSHLSESATRKGIPSPQPMLGKTKVGKIWEEFCFRCGEAGNLMPCNSERCPKAYHPLCLGRDRWPEGKWLCPWHHCFKCSGRAELWCRHCPNAVCADHSDCITLHPVLGSLCDKHDDEDIQFKVNLVKQHGLASHLPCPSPSLEQLRVWRAALGVKEDSGSTPTSGLGGKKNRISQQSEGTLTKVRPRPSLSDVTNIETGDQLAPIQREKFQARLDRVMGEEEEEDSDLSGEGCSYKVLVEDRVKTKADVDSENNQKFGRQSLGTRLPVKPKTQLAPRKRNEETLRISVPVFESLSANTSFSQKGYRGPYYCLGEACSFVLEEFGNVTQKKLVNHWTANHDDIRTMLYYDHFSHSVLNTKVILNNIGLCSSSGCNTVLFSSRRTDFSTNVNTHWKRFHPEIEINETNMVNVVSTVPQLTSDQAVSLVKKLSIYSGNPGLISGEEFTNITEEEKEDDVEIQEDIISGEAESEPGCGPFKCSGCDYQHDYSLHSSRSILAHWTNSHDTRPETLRFTDLSTGRPLTAKHFFKTIGRCTVESCGHLIGNNGRDNALFRRIRKHWTEHHSELSDTPDTEKVKLIDIGRSEEESRDHHGEDFRKTDLSQVSQFSCGNCDKSLSLSAGSQAALQHWAKHSLHPATLQLVRSRDMLRLNIRQLYRWIYRCLAKNCSFMAVSNDSSREAEGKVREHWLRSHNTACPPRLEEATHLGYQCSLCQEVLLEKSEWSHHLATRHPGVDRGGEGVHLTDLETGAQLSESEIPLSQETEQESQETGSEAVTVFQCPAVTKGGRQCPELAMDPTTLMTHWGSQHITNGAEFSPAELSILSVTHYQCPVTACHFRHLSRHSVRKHWDAEHRDQPDKFIVLQYCPRASETKGGQEKEGRKRGHGSDSSQETKAAKEKKFDCEFQANNPDTAIIVSELAQP